MCNDISIVMLGFEKQPKLTKEQPIVNFFNFFKDSRRDSNGIFYSPFEAYRSPHENSVRFERKFVQPFYTMWGSMCAMTITSYGWDLRNIDKSDPGTANCELLHFFSKTVVTIRTKVSTAISHYMGDLYRQ